ncbi:MAG: MlaD family protein [Bacteroidota bacterium]|nr:MlaD family protein [Bacteroidota bacterium]
MSESPNKRAIMVGLFIAIGLSFLIAGIMIIGNVHETFKSKIRIVAFFEDVNGLQKGSNIWFSGVKVGIVSEVKLYKKSQVVIMMKVETNAQQYIRKDAFVKIGSDALIGNKILVIYGGTPRYAQVEEGDTLGVEKAFSTEDMINMLQENNKNFLAITTDFKSISHKLAGGDGTLGKLLNNNDVYNNIDAATASLHIASAKAEQLITSLSVYSAGLNKKGTLANELVTDTILYNSLRLSVLQLRKISDTASVFINGLKHAGSNPNTPVGVLLHDEVAGAHLKETIKNLESSSKKLDQDLEAIQHSFLLRGFFKKKPKAKK